MLTIRKTPDIHPAYDFSQIAPRERIVFFDIETTGLSASRAGLYLIGAVYFEAGAWQLVQWFAESVFDEEEMVHAFAGLLSEKRRAAQRDGGKYASVVLVHYNGDMFDIPFIRRVAQHYRLPDVFTGTVSVDLYKKTKPYKAFLGLPDCKLKSVERLFGIFRDDRYSGGELIYVYEEYLRLKNLDDGSCEYNAQNLALREQLLETLLLHNAEDLFNLPMICGVMGFEALFSGRLSFREAELVRLPGISGAEERQVLDLRFSLPEGLPRGMSFEDETYAADLGDILNITAELCRGELKYFFPDYKNYYYLPAEDCAVHKSVGEFVDRKARKQATARTCYQRKAGVFLPQPEAVFEPSFYEEYKGKRQYAVYSDSLLTDGGRLSAYAAAVLRHFLARQKDSRSTAEC
ncbi:MAG: ribonuclease H-like domain-containing protein [Eubacteriales bacterium]|nr:ribonuclease H-like domain-containing protein [Eubacteriales bacterium]